MKALLLSAAAVITTLVAVSSIYTSERAPTPSLGLRFDDKCPEALAVECIGDIQITTRDCEKAMHDVADVTDKLSCIKDLLNDRKVCLPCICSLTEKHVKIEGCD